MPIPEVKLYLKGKPIKASIKELNNVDIEANHLSNDFRARCLRLGFKLLKVYPVYRINWEMDNWEAIATKNNKRYRINTDHEALHWKIFK